MDALYGNLLEIYREGSDAIRIGNQLFGDSGCSLLGDFIDLIDRSHYDHKFPEEYPVYLRYRQSRGGSSLGVCRPGSVDGGAYEGVFAGGMEGRICGGVTSCENGEKVGEKKLCLLDDPKYEDGVKNNSCVNNSVKSGPVKNSGKNVFSNNNGEKDNNLHIPLYASNNLRVLECEANNITGVGLSHLLLPLEKAEKLEILNLEWNNIGEGKQFEALCFSLCKHKNLKEIIFKECHIGKSGARALGNLIKHNRSVESLNISHNAITAEGAVYLLEALKHNSIVKFIDYSGNDISYRISLDIEHLLRRNQAGCKSPEEIQIKRLGEQIYLLRNAHEREVENFKNKLGMLSQTLNKLLEERKNMAANIHFLEGEKQQHTLELNTSTEEKNKLKNILEMLEKKCDKMEVDFQALEPQQECLKKEVIEKANEIHLLNEEVNQRKFENSESGQIIAKLEKTIEKGENNNKKIKLEYEQAQKYIAEHRRENVDEITNLTTSNYSLQLQMNDLHQQKYMLEDQTQTLTETIRILRLNFSTESSRANENMKKLNDLNAEKSHIIDEKSHNISTLRDELKQVRVEILNNASVREELQANLASYRDELSTLKTQNLDLIAEQGDAENRWKQIFNDLETRNKLKDRSITKKEDSILALQNKIDALEAHISSEKDVNASLENSLKDKDKQIANYITIIQQSEINQKKMIQQARSQLASALHAFDDDGISGIEVCDISVRGVDV